MWAGDLNVSHTELDVTHPKFFQQQGELSRHRACSGFLTMVCCKGPEGQPGYTAIEQQLFTSALSQLGFVRPLPSACLARYLDHSHYDRWMCTAASIPRRGLAAGLALPWAASIR